MPNLIPYNMVAKTRKTAFGIVINAGDKVKAYVGPNGYASLIRNQNIKFKPDEYNLYISDEEYDELLNTK